MAILRYKFRRIIVLSLGVAALWWVFTGVADVAKTQNQAELPAPSVYFKPKGGLGNQLYEYACSYALARRLNFPLYVRVPDDDKAKRRRFGPRNRTFVLDFFKIPLPPTRSVNSSWRVKGLTELDEEALLYRNYDSWPNLDQLRLNPTGYCQGLVFFSGYEAELLPLFQVKEEALSSNYMEFSEKIRLRKCSICMHIRRGDLKSSWFSFLPPSFFPKALRTMNATLRRRKVPGCVGPGSEIRKIFVFSDSTLTSLKEEFGEKFFQDLEPFEMVSGHGLNSIEEFKLMSECHHNIIPPSTYSWWAASLNTNKKKVVVAAKTPELGFSGEDDLYVPAIL